jgi:hypothetical protein
VHNSCAPAFDDLHKLSGNIALQTALSKEHQGEVLRSGLYLICTPGETSQFEALADIQRFSGIPRLQSGVPVPGWKLNRSKGEAPDTGQ